MTFKKIGLSLLVFLIVYWVIAIFLIITLIGLGVALFFYLTNENSFYFNWINEFSYAIKKAIPSGGVLGAGIWIKAKIEENKSKKSLNGAQK